MTQRQKVFAHEYIQHGNATEAAKAAGYSPRSAHVQGCTLLKNPKVADYIQNLQNRSAVAASCTYEEHLDKLAELRDAALECGQISAAVAAETARGKAAGHYTERIKAQVEQVPRLAFRRREAEAPLA